MGVLSQFNCLKITDPKKPRVSKSNSNDHKMSSSLQSTNYETSNGTSQTIYETVEGSHEYKIKRYSQAKGMGVGKFMTSAKFKVGGYDWVIRLYPDGCDEAHQEYVGVYIMLVTPGEVRAWCQFKLLDQSGKGIHRLHNLPKPLKTFNTVKPLWGYEQYMKRSELELETSGYLKDDCLRIYCKVGVLQKRDEEGKHYVIPVPPSENFKGLLESEIGSDITFQVGSECFKAHKLILAARSPVFRAQFFGLVGNTHMETVVIEEFDSLAFKAMLLFLYSDELPDLHSLSTSTILMQHLLAGADRFDLPRLKLMCEDKLCKQITTDTVATTLVLAEQHQCLQLKTACLNFAAKHLGEIMKSDGYTYLLTCCPSLVEDLQQQPHL